MLDLREFWGGLWPDAVATLPIGCPKLKPPRPINHQATDLVRAEGRLTPDEPLSLTVRDRNVGRSLATHST
jgi:hypothetical protein